MSRDGVTTSQINRACAHLADNGLAVTVDAVRARIGGSNSTLAPVVRAWKEANKDVVNPMNTGLPADLVQSVKELHERMQAHATLRVEEAESRAAEKISQLEHVIGDAAVREKDLDEDNARLRSQIAELQTQVQTRDAQSIAANLRIKELETVLDQQSRQLVQRDNDLTSARADFSELQIRAGNQMQAVRTEAAQRLDEASSKALELRTDNVRLAARVELLDRDNVQLRAELETGRESVEQTRLALSQSQEKNARLESQLTDMAGASNHSQAQLKQTTNELNEMRLALATKEGEARILQRDLSRLQSLYDKLNQDGVVWRQERHQMSETIRQLEQVRSGRSD